MAFLLCIKLTLDWVVLKSKEETMLAEQVYYRKLLEKVNVVKLKKGRRKCFNQE